MYIQKLLIEAVQGKLTLLKAGALEGGFKFAKLELKSKNIDAPECFVMWESKSRGTQEQMISKGKRDDMSHWIILETIL